MWFQVFMLVFALVFLVGGMMRIVEFNGLGLGRFLKPTLIAAHILGCLLFSSAIALAGIDIHQERPMYMRVFILSSLGILLPVHIFLGLKRRIALRDAQNKS